MAGLAERIDEARRAEALADAPPLVPVARDGALPLSLSQQRLWFLDQLQPESPFYNVPIGVELEGQLDVAALEQSLVEVIRRHEVLRTTFPAVGGEPRQVIAAEAQLTLPTLDLTSLEAGPQAAEVARISREEAQRRFDLGTGPLVRAVLLRLAARSHRLLFVMHHAVSDGWSMGVLVHEIKALYEAFTAGRPSPLPPLPIQYTDFAAWERRWLAGPVLEAQLAYWKQQLAGAPPALELPTDRPRPPVQTFRGATHDVALSRELSAKLEALSRREGATTFMTLLAAFQTLLHRYTGQEDIVVGSPIANRTRGEVEGLIGFFVNTLALRTDLSGAPSFRELLGRVREVTLGAYAHQHLPFDALVAELAPSRDASRSPLFQVLFSLQNAPMPALTLPGLTLRASPLESDTAKFDLSLLLSETAEGIRGALEYNTDLFDAATSARMVEHLHMLLEGIVADPDRRVPELPLLTAADRHRLLVEWNDTAAAYPEDACVHTLFEAQVERTPDAAAVAFGDRRLTYRELDARADQLAAHLRHLGVAPDARVGLCVERSIEMVVAVLAILKAGGAYVPLDPAYPTDRLAFMMEDAQVTVLLAGEQALAALPPARVPVVRLDAPSADLERGTTESPGRRARPEDAAYVIYTSGSTGRPKGVVMPHRPLVNLVTWQLATSPAPFKTLQLTSPSFDVFFQELFTTWCAGGLLVLISEEARRDAVRLRQVLADERIERIFLPPVALYQLAEAEGAAPLPGSLREVITAGEQLQITARVASLLGRVPSVTLKNHYGPSESHVVTEHVLAGPTEGWPAVPPIGRPIHNTRIYVLDTRREPVPIGVPGELYIGGVCLARGYWNRPELDVSAVRARPVLRGARSDDVPHGGPGSLALGR
ncbi:MAG: amino acid adenylation domain-containing protein [Minicystis sp.]